MEQAEPDEKLFSFCVNGSGVSVQASAELSLLTALRQDLGLKGTRVGCLRGNCGACTVLLDGRPVQSCTTPLDAIEGRKVVTIEGLCTDGKPGKVQQAFLDQQAAQCGYCINGIIMTVTGLSERVPAATRRQIVEALDERHLCRCGAQSRILRAIDQAFGDAPGRQP